MLDRSAEGAVCFAGTRGREPFIRYQREDIVAAGRPGAPVLRHDTSMLSEQVQLQRYDSVVRQRHTRTTIQDVVRTARHTDLRYAVLHLCAKVRNLFMTGNGHR